jgi:hypothetical protein
MSIQADPFSVPYGVNPVNTQPSRPSSHANTPVPAGTLVLLPSGEGPEDLHLVRVRQNFGCHIPELVLLGFTPTLPPNLLKSTTEYRHYRYIAEHQIPSPD